MNKTIIFKAMKKTIIFTVLFIILSALIFFSHLFGHPVWGEKIILTQPNGIKIVGYIYGDEFHRRIETEEGYTIILNEQTGTIEYAVLENNKLVPSGMVVGMARTSYLEQINFPKHLTDRKYRIAEIREKSPEKFYELKPWSQKELKIQALEGTKKVFVVCVEFQPEDSPPTEWYEGTYSPSGFDVRLFSTDPSDISMTNYYKSNSYNKFWPEGYTYPDWVTLPQTASWYKENDSWRQVITDALDEIRNIDPSFDFTQHATSGDMDLIVVWAGQTEGWDDFYWPKMSMALIQRYGVRVKFYNVVNERNNDGSENDDISVFCHEYGHMTGSPDLYDYSSFQLVPMGLYCLMGFDSYKTNFCGYLKWRVYGWITPEEVFSSGTHNVDALGLSSVSNPRLYKINIESPEEFLLLENRHNGADPDYENRSGRRSGLLITHIDENYPPNDCLPDYSFYGVEAIVPGLDPSITTLEEYAAYYGEMVFASGYGFTRLEPAYPDDQPAGDYLVLTSGDDTENVIYRNTQGHTKSTSIYLDDISSSQQTMSFTATIPPMSPAISGSVKTPDGDGIEGVTLSFSAGGGETTTDADGNYVHDVPLDWTGTVTPSNTGLIFDPSSRSYSNVTSSKIEQGYSASTSFLKGRVINDASTGIEDVIVQVFSTAGSFITYALTDNNGDYLVGDLNTGDYKIWFWPAVSSGMYSLEWYNDKDSFATADSVSIIEGNTTSDIDAVLEKGGNIEGRVTNILGAGIELVLVDIYSSSGNQIDYYFTDSDGNYSMPSLKAGSYKINFDTTYAIGDYNSEWYNDKDSIDTADSVLVEDWSITSSINAELSTTNPYISGAVKTSEDIGIAGVIISFSDEGDAVTDSNGNYFHTVSNGWSGTATPSKEGYAFSPASRTYTNVTSDLLNEGYTATIVTTPTISGKVKTSDGTGIEGVTITFSNEGGSTTTNSAGNYSHGVSSGWSGTASPSKAGYTFSPPSRDYTNVTSDQTDQNYTATPTVITYTISGKVSLTGGSSSVRARNQAGLSGVLMFGLPGSPTTDASGNYSATVEHSWSGTVIPTKAGYSFSPSSRTYPNVTSDQASQDYTAAVIGTGISWTTGGPYGGYINSLSISHTNPDIIYAGTIDGVYKTIDAGANWTKTGFPGQEFGAYQYPGNPDIVVSPDDNDVVYTGTRRLGIYKSEDGGNTWTQKGLSGLKVNAIAIDPNNSSIIYAGTGDWWVSYEGDITAIYKSTDGGENWELKHTLSESYQVNVILIDPDNSSYIYAGVVGDWQCFLKSTDGGNTWQQKLLASSSNNYLYSLAMTPAGDSSPTIYAVGGEFKGEGDLYKSTDRGENWTKVECPYTTMYDGKCLAVDPISPEWVYIGTKDTEKPLYAYNDEEDLWYYVGGDLPPQPPSIIAVNPQESRIFYLGFFEAGVYKYINDTWNLTNMMGTKINGLAIHPLSSDTTFAVIEGSGYSLTRTTDRGTSWSNLANSPFGIGAVAIDPQNPAIIYVGEGYDLYGSVEWGIYKSTDGGQNWQFKKLFSLSGAFNIGVSDIWVSPADSNLMLVTVEGLNVPMPGGLYRSTDGGETWGKAISGSFIALASDPANHDVIYSGQEKSAQIYRSADGGGSWTEITPADGFGDVQDIEVDSDSQVYVATNSGLWKRVGSSWAELSGLPTEDITALAIDKSPSPNIIYAGTSGYGVYSSHDGGSAWTPFNNGLENLDITKLAASDTNTKVLYAGTAYGGAWSIATVTTYAISGQVGLSEGSIEMKIAGGDSKLAGNRQTNKPNVASRVGEMITQAELSVVLMSGLPGNPITDASGNYSAAVEEGWSGTVTPTKAGYTFSPPSRTYTNVTSDQTGENYAATVFKPSISGSVKTSAGTRVGGVTITFSDGGGTASTNSNGDYSHEVSYGWSGTATPAKAGCTFAPTSRDYTYVTSDQTDQDYTAAILTYTISGNVSTSDASVRIQAAAGLSGVVMDGLPGNPTTDASGNYTATADYGFSGTVTPTKAGYSFSPPSRDYTNVTSDQQDHNYTASIAQHMLTIVAGTGGTTNPTPDNYQHDYGTQVQVTAVPDSGYQFSGWSGDASGTTNPITINMDADKSITANFTPPPPEEPGGGDGGAKKGGCFIATAAYGSPLHPHLDILRDFRDKYLMHHGFGRKLVELYYRYSPSIANFIARHKLLKAAVRINLLPLIAFGYSIVNFGPVATAMLLIFMLIFPILFLRFYPGKLRILE